MRILVAEDEAVSQRVLESTLRRWGYDVVVAADGLEAFRILNEPDAPKLAVLDWLMPGLDGVEICKEIRRDCSATYTYIVLLTSKKDRCDVIAGLDAGADDYIVKPFDPQELQVRLRTGKRILYLQEQLIAARESLREQATHDSLTGLYNRSALFEQLASELGRRRRHGGSLGVVLIDLDRFKEVNDEYGHLVGDHVLRAAAKAMQKCTRSYDIIGRFGGEEFIVVLPGCDKMNAVSHAERMRAAVNQAAVHLADSCVQISASFGVTVTTPGSDPDACQLIRAADMALYRAKDNGRNRVEFAACEDLAPSVCG